MRCTSSDEAGRDEKCDLWDGCESLGSLLSTQYHRDVPARMNRQSLNSPALLRGWETAAQDVDLVAHDIMFDRQTAELLMDEIIDMGVGEVGVHFETAQVVNLSPGPDLAAVEVANLRGSRVAGHGREVIGCGDGRRRRLRGEVGCFDIAPERRRRRIYI